MASSRSDRKKRHRVCCALGVEVVLLVSAFFAAGPVESVNVQHHSWNRQEHRQEQHLPQQHQHQKRGTPSDREHRVSFLHNFSAKQLEPQRQQQLQVRVHSTPPANTVNGVAYEEDSSRGRDRFSSRQLTSFVRTSLTEKEVPAKRIGTSYPQHQLQDGRKAGASASSAAVRQSHSFRPAGPHRQDTGGSRSFVGDGEQRLPGEGRADPALFRSSSYSYSGVQNVAAFPSPISNPGRAAPATSARREVFIEAAARDEGAGEEAAASSARAHATAARTDAYAIPAGTAAAIGEDDTHGEAARAGVPAGVLATAAPAALARRSADGAAALLPAPSRASLERKRLSLSREQISQKEAILVEHQHAAHAEPVEAATPKPPTAGHAVAAAFASVAAKDTVAPSDPVAASFSTPAGSAAPIALPSTDSLSLSSVAANIGDAHVSPAASPAPGASSAVAAEEFTAAPPLPYVELQQPSWSSQGTAEVTSTTGLRLVDIATPSAAAAGIPPFKANVAGTGTAEEPAANLSDRGLALNVRPLLAYPTAGATPPTALSDPVSEAAPPPLTPLPTASPPASPLPTHPAGTAQVLPVPPLPAAASLPVASFSVPPDRVTGTTSSSGYLTHDPPASVVPLPATPILGAAPPGGVTAPTAPDASPASAAPAAFAAPAALAAPVTPAVPPTPAAPAVPPVPAAPAAPPAPAVPSVPPAPAALAVPPPPGDLVAAAAPATRAAPGVPAAPAAPASDTAPAPEATHAPAPGVPPAPAGHASGDDAPGATVLAAADAAARSVTHDAAPVAPDPTTAAPLLDPARIATAAAEKEGTSESASPEYRATRERNYGQACFDACSCWPVWSLGILLLVLNLTASFVAFYHTANLFSRGLLSSQFYRGGGYWLLGVAGLGFVTGALIGALVPPSCWAGALYLGGFFVSLFLSFVLIGRRGALLGSFGGVGAGGVIGHFTQTGSLGIVIGMVLGLLFGIVIGFAPICRGLKINERYVRASLGAERRLRRGRFTEDHLDKGEKSPSAVSSNLRSRYTGSPRESPTSTPHTSLDYMLPPLETSAAAAELAAAAETTASANSATADGGPKDAAPVDGGLHVNDRGPPAVDRPHDAA